VFIDSIKLNQINLFMIKSGDAHTG